MDVSDKSPACLNTKIMNYMLYELQKLPHASYQSMFAVLDTIMLIVDSVE